MEPTRKRRPAGARAGMTTRRSQCSRRARPSGVATWSSFSMSSQMIRSGRCGPTRMPRKAAPEPLAWTVMPVVVVNLDSDHLGEEGTEPRRHGATEGEEEEEYEGWEGDGEARDARSDWAAG